MRIAASERTRHFIVRGHTGEVLPDALLDTLRMHEVRAGWATGHGVLEDIELRATETRVREPGEVRLIPGPARAAIIDVAIGDHEGDVSVGVRVVISYETPTGLVTVAGELVRARIVGMEAHVVSMEDTRIERGVDRSSGVWLWSVDVAGGAPPPPQKAKSPEAWGEAIAASEAKAIPRAPISKPMMTAAPIPQRPAPPPKPDEEEDAPFPEAGDVVEHFAFGRCEVLKSDGDRLHLKVGKDGRIREIALEMLKVSPLESGDPGRKRFKLDRRI